MTIEKKTFDLNEQTPRPQPLPEALAKNFVNGKLLETAAIVHEGDKSTLYRCFDRDEAIPGLDKTRLSIDYRKYHETMENRYDQLRFDYTRPDPNNPENMQTFVEMHLAIVDPQKSFVLAHRYVRPELRSRSGLGSRLLVTVEDWLRQVAREVGHPINIGLQTGQESVMRWIQKMGYRIREDQRDELTEVMEHPERFVRDAVILSEESRMQGAVKDLYTFRKGKTGRYMEDAIRLTFEKEISNR